MVVIRNARRSSAALLGAVLAATSFAGIAGAADAPAIPVGVFIPVELTAQISSQTAHVGDAFAFKTTKDEKLGTLDVPSGTPGSGRIAVVVPAHDKQNGSVSLQVDELTLSSGAVVWVNIDPSRPPTGHLSDKHTRYYILPLPIGVLPGAIRSVSGNMILEPGTGFRVVTTAPRAAPAPLVTAPPTAVPTSPASSAPAPAAS